MRMIALMLALSTPGFCAEAPAPQPPSVWAKKGSYPPRPGNDVQMLVDGQAAYAEVSKAMHRAKKFIYATFSYGDEDFGLVPESGETMFSLLRERRKDGVEVKLVIWQPAAKTPDTLPEAKIEGVNEGPGSIEARWDKAPGYLGWYHGVHNTWRPIPLWFPAAIGCNHQKTYVMDDGEGGVVSFVGGINPVQAYWDTPSHDALDARRVEKGKDPIKGLEDTPPLHDIFYKIVGPSAGDVISNFVERYNGASGKHAEATTDAKAPFKPEDIPQVEGGVMAQIVRTIAPRKYKTKRGGDTGIKELYLNALNAAAAGTLVYIENQYFFDHVIIDAIHDAAERGAKIIAVLTDKPDEGTKQAGLESLMEWIAKGEAKGDETAANRNVVLLTLGNARPDPRDPSKSINSETYIHSKTMAVLDKEWAAWTGGSANIAFTSMLFHAEENVAVQDPKKIREWAARLWAEHLQIPLEKALALTQDNDAAFNFFRRRAAEDQDLLEKDMAPVSRVFPWGKKFPARDLKGIDLKSVPDIAAAPKAETFAAQSFDLPRMSVADLPAPGPDAVPAAQGALIESAASAPVKEGRVYYSRRPSGEAPGEGVSAETIVNLGEYAAEAQRRCKAYGLKCVESHFDAAYASPLDKEYLIKAYREVLAERAAGRSVFLDAGLQDERSAAVAAALRIRESCGKPADKDLLWSAVQETLAERGFEAKYLLLAADIKSWVFEAEKNPWLCE